MRQLEEWGWREHTTRDSGPQAPTIAEWVGHEGKHRARPPQSWTSSPRRFREQRDCLEAEELLANRGPLYPRLPGGDRLIGGTLSATERFVAEKPSEEPGAVLQHYTFDDDAAVWMETAKTISPVGRPEEAPTGNPNHAYRDCDGPDSIAERTSLDPRARMRCTAVFDSGVTRMHEADDSDQEALLARRGLTTDPANPGPGNYQIIEPCDWQRHDLVIKGSLELRLEDRPRPSSVFVSHKRQRSKKPTVESPGKSRRCVCARRLHAHRALGAEHRPR